MKFDYEGIKDITGHEMVESNIKGNPSYEWIDIVGIPQRPTDL